MQTHRASKSSSEWPNVPLFVRVKGKLRDRFLVYNECAYAMVNQKSKQAYKHTHTYTLRRVPVKRASRDICRCICWRSHPNTQFTIIVLLSFYIRLESIRAKKQQQQRRRIWSVEGELCMIEWQIVNVSLPCKNAMAKWKRNEKKQSF